MPLEKITSTGADYALVTENSNNHADTREVSILEKKDFDFLEIQSGSSATETEPTSNQPFSITNYTFAYREYVGPTINPRRFQANYANVCAKVDTKTKEKISALVYSNIKPMHDRKEDVIFKSLLNTKAMTECIQKNFKANPELQAKIDQLIATLLVDAHLKKLYLELKNDQKKTEEKLEKIMAEYKRIV